MDETIEPKQAKYGSAEIGAIAHLYRGEMYRSKIWRTRLDATTNWAVVTVGIALSVTFTSENASPLPIVLAGGLLLMFLLFEARRYRFFDIWRTRVRILETSFYGPILRGKGVNTDNGWDGVLADDYTGLYYHITYSEAVGRRLRRTYGAIFAIQMLSYLGKLAIHPTPVSSLDDMVDRAQIGPVDGTLVFVVFVVFYLGLLVFALWSLKDQKAVGRAHTLVGHKDRMRDLTKTEIY